MTFGILHIAWPTGWPRASWKSTSVKTKIGVSREKRKLSLLQEKKKKRERETAVQAALSVIFNYCFGHNELPQIQLVSLEAKSSIWQVKANTASPGQTYSHVQTKTKREQSEDNSTWAAVTVYRSRVKQESGIGHTGQLDKIYSPMPLVKKALTPHKSLAWNRFCQSFKYHRRSLF